MLSLRSTLKNVEGGVLQIWKIDQEIRKTPFGSGALVPVGRLKRHWWRESFLANFEVAFGLPSAGTRDPDSRGEPPEMTRSTFVSAQTIKLSGQIDRVEIAADQTLIAYDYKLSTGSTLIR